MTTQCPSDTARLHLLTSVQRIAAVQREQRLREIAESFAEFLERDCGLRLADESPRPNEWLEHNENEKREVYQW